MVDIELNINAVNGGIRGERCGIFQLVVAIYRHTARMNPVNRNGSSFALAAQSVKMLVDLAVAVSSSGVFDWTHSPQEQ